MISVTGLKNGVNFEYKEDPWRVIKYQHTHLSRGAGTIRVRARNLRTGNVLELSFKSGEMVEDILVTKKMMQYLYLDGEEFVFMDPQSFEQITIGNHILGDDAAYLQEGTEVQVLFWDEEALGVDLPAKMTFTVAEAAPGEKGDSASNMYKDAKLENGLKIRVPLFINAGDRIRVDTRNGSYIERANS